MILVVEVPKLNKGKSLELRQKIDLIKYFSFSDNLIFCIHLDFCLLINFYNRFFSEYEPVFIENIIYMFEVLIFSISIFLNCSIELG